MTIDISLFEDTGPVTVGRGTTRAEVDNIGWKADGTGEGGNNYAFAPVVRPLDPDGLWTGSYKKYHFAKIYGTYTNASRIRIKIKNGVTGAPPEDYESETQVVGDTAEQQVRIFYKLTNVYEEPNDTWDGELRFVESGETILYPSVSTTGPEGTQVYQQYLATNTTYYTQYLVTQLVVPYSTNAGNIGEVNIEWYIDEYEDGDL